MIKNTNPTLNAKVSNHVVTIKGKLTNGGASIKGSLSSGSSGVSSYPNLSDKPQINNVTVLGNKTGEDYNLQNKMSELTVQEIEKILYLDN